MYVKLAPNSKVPVAGEWQKSPRPWEGFNNGLVLKDHTVVDFDQIEPGRDFYRKHPELCSVICRTRRGVHFHFSGETRGRRFEHGDIKSGEHAYVLVPPSRIDGFDYEWICQGELLPFPEELFPDTGRKVVRQIVKNVRSYVAKIPSLADGKGSAGLIRAAAVCRDAGIPPAEAMLILLEWNANPEVVRPPWPAEEIARAVTNIYDKKGA